MTQAIERIKQKLTFDQFLDWYPEGSGIYELVEGEIIEMRATRQHDDITFFILFAFNDEIRHLQLDYVVNNTAIIQTGENQGRKPDISIIKRADWSTIRSSYAALDKGIALAVEVVSTNWEDDYIDKLEEYQRLGISEYWIVDYLALGSRHYLGKPKIPTVFVHLLDKNGVYQSTSYRDKDPILSRTFPEMKLTAAQVLGA
ncbi:Uma2 family endonuclease [Limnofasciculus baicalensis]|uniref:Uma2 family endonuclease n=1 Tax=Limnofasciculus baicalensis BBK-W-15 TaxID=2699891 RepID=A0AAE3KLB8_9CYAN|nr:Uma2 family endonuclease [Limnofasciculus baicalensis]MCP2727919.1 Uma2 family endonuclease [Limnofasciculus baicalensis BBK-W-15]